MKIIMYLLQPAGADFDRREAKDAGKLGIMNGTRDAYIENSMPNLLLRESSSFNARTIYSEFKIIHAMTSPGLIPYLLNARMMPRVRSAIPRC